MCVAMHLRESILSFLPAAPRLGSRHCNHRASHALTRLEWVGFILMTDILRVSLTKTCYSSFSQEVLARLIEIMNNVELIMTRYNIDSTSPARKLSLKENQKKKRKFLLERMAMSMKSMDIREKTLSSLQSWLEEWSKCLEGVRGKE